MTPQMKKSESLSHVRHALRTPLNQIVGFSEMLLEDAPAPQASEILRAVYSAAQRLCKSVQTLPGDSEEELIELRANLVTPLRALRTNVDQFTGIDATNARPIAAAIVQLERFTNFGTLPDAGFDTAPSSERVQRSNLPAIGTLLIATTDVDSADLRRELETRGYTVEHTPTSKDALLKLRSGCFDAVLLASSFPQADALEILQGIRSDQQLSEVAVLVLHGRSGLTAADEISRAEEYLPEPVDPVLLHARLSGALERKRLKDKQRLKQLELAQLNEQLRIANQDLKHFAHAASHDLQAPVRTITSYLQLLQRRVGPRVTADESEMFQFAEGAAKRLQRLLQDLLQYSQASAQPHRPEILDGNALSEALLHDLDLLIQQHNASITWDLPPVLWADLAGLRLILQNLIGNAIRYRREENPVLHVSAVPESGHWRFSVRDNGLGIAPEYHAQIFEMFRRLHGEELPGSGIGLTLCRRLVERCGGKIWVESESGVGSTFHFTLPA